jgi:hypothetical protein
MEVHHHAHEHAGKKNWKSYFREFLMLFLAVFCGFMAEYQLEHKIEKDREKAYIKSMIEDLETDKNKLIRSLESFAAQDKSFDTVFAKYDLLAKGYNHALRGSLNRIIGYRDFFPTDKTLQQLKNSGGMRLITNRKAVDGIVGYDYKLKVYDKSLTVLDDVFTKFYDLTLEVQDSRLMEEDLVKIGASKMEKGTNNYLLLADKASLGKYYNRLKTYLRLRIIVERRMTDLNAEATKLIQLLKREYHIE